MWIGLWYKISYEVITNLNILKILPGSFIVNK